MDFQAAANMMKNMSPEQLRMMQQTMANMSPAQLNSMAETARRMGMNVPSINPEDMEKIKNMNTNEFSQQANQAASVYSQQLEYKFRASQQLKQEGNDYLIAGNFSEAVPIYGRAIANLQGNKNPDAVKLLVICHINSARCETSLKNFDAAIEHCNQALTQDPNNAKALYRRGLAREGAQSFELAKADFLLALSLSSGDDVPVIQGAIDRVTPAIKETSSAENTPSNTSDVSATQDDSETPSSSQPAKNDEDEPADQGQKSSFSEKPSPSNTQQAIENEAPQSNPNSQSTSSSVTSVPSVPSASTAATSVPSFPPRGMPDLPMETVSKLMSSMSPEDMQAMMEMSTSMMQGGQPNFTPENMAKMTKLMSKLDANDIQAMTKAAASRGLNPLDPVASSSSAPASSSSSSSASAVSPLAASPSPSSFPAVPPVPMETVSKLMSSMSPEDMQAMMEMSSSMMQGGKPNFSPENMAKMSKLVSKLDPADLTAMAQAASAQGANRFGAFPGVTNSTATANTDADADTDADAPSSSSASTTGTQPAPALPMDAMAKMMQSMSPEDMQTMMELSSTMMQGGKPKLSADNISKLTGLLSKMDPEHIAAMSKMAGASGAGGAVPEQLKGGISQSQARQLLMVVKFIHSASSAIVQLKRFLSTLQGKAILVALLAIVVYFMYVRWFGATTADAIHNSNPLPPAYDEAEDY